MTPTEVAFEQDAVHVTVQDATGSLGIRPGHAPLVTALVPGIVMARVAGGRESYVAVDGGVMLVDGKTVEIASRRAVTGDNLDHLEGTVLAGFEKDAADDAANRVAFEKMRIQFMQGVLEFDRAGTE